MRNAMTALAALFLFALPAPAHGGGGFRGPNGGVPPGMRGHWERGIPCACALPDCAQCGAGMLRPGDLARCSIAMRDVEAWDDVVRCRITVTIRAREGEGRVDAWVPVRTGTLFAAVGGSVSLGGETLTASLRPSLDARKTYLWERKRYAVDPMLVEARREGTLDVRAFPVKADEDTVLVIEGYRLAPAPLETGVRLYRTGTRVLAVQPGGRFDGRTLAFLDADDAARRFAVAPKEVPFVRALESALTGGGGAAAGADTSLLAVAEGATPPPLVGEYRWCEGTPPPPPPAQSAAATAATTAPATTPGTSARP